jgi:hypothetical protein
MKVRIEVTPDGVGQIIEDVMYLNRLSESGGDDILSPETHQLLQDVITAAQEKAAAMVQEGNQFSEVFDEQAVQDLSSGGEDMEKGGTNGERNE